VKLHDPSMFTETGSGLALAGQRCQDCGKIAFPRKRVCPACFGENLEDQALSTTGVLHTYTCTYVGAPHLPSPYLLGFVDVPEGVRLLSLLVDCEPWERVLRAGMPMEMTIGPLMPDESGEILHTYKFRPAAQDRAIA
jgi:uncharacterized OB-fold protein